MKTILFSVLLFPVLYSITSCTNQESAPAGGATTTPVENAATPASLVKRGEYLVTIMGCDDCHSPKAMTPQGPVPDKNRRLSGHPANEPLPKISDKGMVAPGQWALFNGGLTAAAGPWGISFSANLTPDVSGIGEWSYEQFKKALTEGKLKGLDNGRPLLPPMPWPNYSHMKDEDVQAVFAYLKSLPPVSNVVPAPIPPTEL